MEKIDILTLSFWEKCFQEKLALLSKQPNISMNTRRNRGGSMIKELWQKYEPS